MFTIEIDVEQGDVDVVIARRCQSQSKIAERTKYRSTFSLERPREIRSNEIFVQIGSASSSASVCQYVEMSVVDVSLQNKTITPISDTTNRNSTIALIHN